MKTSSRVICRCYWSGLVSAGEGRMPRWPRPRRRGGERRSRRARSTGRAPRPCPPQPQPRTTPAFVFLPKKTPHLHHPDPPQDSAPAGNSPAPAEPLGDIRGEAKRFWECTVGVGMGGTHGLGDDSANEGAEQRSKAAVPGLSRLSPVPRVCPCGFPGSGRVPAGPRRQRPGCSGDPAAHGARGKAGLRRFAGPEKGEKRREKNPSKIK